MIINYCDLFKVKITLQLVLGICFAFFLHFHLGIVPVACCITVSIDGATLDTAAASMCYIPPM